MSKSVNDTSSETEDPDEFAVEPQLDQDLDLPAMNVKVAHPAVAGMPKPDLDIPDTDADATAASLHMDEDADD